MKEVSLDSIINAIKEQTLEYFSEKEQEYGYDCEDISIYMYIEKHRPKNPKREENKR